MINDEKDIKEYITKMEYEYSKEKAKELQKIRIKGLLGTAFLCFFLLVGAIFLFGIGNGKIKTVVNYLESEPTYETVEVPKHVDIYEKQYVYIQSAPIIPTKISGKEIILLDKSGSMKDFVTEVFIENVEFFKQRDVWSFDIELQINVTDIKEIEFGKDTDIFTPLNTAAKEGYNTIWICSDMEHNTGDMILTEDLSDVNVIIYSPKKLGKKSTETIETLIQNCASVQVITMR